MPDDNLPAEGLLLTAYREDETWRLVRLSKLLAILAMSEFSPITKICHLHDSKGDLYVVWREPPNCMECDYRIEVNSAWAMLDQTPVHHGIGSIYDDPQKVCAYEPLSDSYEMQYRYGSRELAWKMGQQEPAGEIDERAT